jgi:hypothetical protein
MPPISALGTTRYGALSTLGRYGGYSLIRGDQPSILSLLPYISTYIFGTNICRTPAPLFSVNPRRPHRHRGTRKAGRPMADGVPNVTNTDSDSLFHFPWRLSAVVQSCSESLVHPVQIEVGTGPYLLPVVLPCIHISVPSARLASNCSPVQFIGG